MQCSCLVFQHARFFIYKFRIFAGQYSYFIYLLCLITALNNCLSFYLSTGSFACACNPGYFGSGLSCSDVDECSTSPCDAHATCTNESGGYSCSCESGYSGDGVTCADIDECATAPCAATAACHNTQAWVLCFIYSLVVRIALQNLIFTSFFIHYFFVCFFRYPRNQEASRVRAMPDITVMDSTVPMLMSAHRTRVTQMPSATIRPAGTHARATQASPVMASHAPMLTSVPPHHATAMPRAPTNKDSGCQLFTYLHNLIIFIF